MYAPIASTVGLGLLFASKISWAKVDPNAGGRPFGGFAATVPGLIEAEEFDVGGEGVAYLDTTAGNQRNVLRPHEDVDIERLGTGFNVASIAAGEYLRYTVDVKENVEAFLFTFRVASAGNRGKFRMVAGGTGCGDFVVDLTQQVSVWSTGGFSEADYIDIEREGQGLKAGPHLLWLCAEGPNFNIDSFTMTARRPPMPEPMDPPTPAPTDPSVLGGAFEGVPAAVPGLIEAERFDVGGEGVAYTDTTAGNKRNVLRPHEDVDIERLGIGFNVANIVAGEYLRYTVDVKEDVEAFLFTFRVASAGNRGKFRIVAGGTGCDDFVVDLTQQVSVWSTGGFSEANYIDIEREGQGLKTGLKLLWLCAEGPNFNVDSFTMTARGPRMPQPTDPITPAPTNPSLWGGAFEGVPAAVPGLIEAERFDVGGEGVAYTDTTAGNKKHVLRPDEDVDIERLGTGFNVGTIDTGEYLRYTVGVTEDVEAFLFTFRVASAGNRGKFRIVAGGTGCGAFVVDLTQQVSVWSTGGFSEADYIDIEREGKGLKAGLNFLWLCAEGHGFNIDSFTMASLDPPTPELTDPPTPKGAFQGVPADVPGLIEAEEFDHGGEGVAYSERTDGVFRTDGSVYIGSTHNGFFVGLLRVGEYLQYTVNILRNLDSVNFSFVIAGERTNPGSFRIVTGGKGCDDYTTDLSGLVTAPVDSGSNFHEVTTFSGRNIGLSAGTAILRLCVIGQRFKIDYFLISDKVNI